MVTWKDQDVKQKKKNLTLTQPLLPAMLVAKYILIVIGAILIITTLYLEYLFIQQYVTTTKAAPLRRILFYPAIIMFIFCTCAISSILFQVASDGLLISQTLSGSFYGLQYYLLLFVLFIRLYLVFKNTKFELSKTTINIYKFVFILSVLLIISIAPIQIFLAHAPIIILSSQALMLLLAIVLNVSLSILFIYKLVQVNKDQDVRNNGNLLDIITKNTILTVISNCATILVILGMVLSIIVPDHNVYWVFTVNVLVQYMDVYTNFICIALTFRCFISFYGNICGLLDRKCKGMCSNAFAEKTMMQMQRFPTTPGSSEDDGDLQMTV